MNMTKEKSRFRWMTLLALVGMSGLVISFAVFMLQFMGLRRNPSWMSTAAMGLFGILGGIGG